ncbi:MAG: hypothetical protein OEM82_15245 [Acidobacteriota bacterium]|nr:hypothetical protein [Acidobacteriota bacterium]MDH3528191.1 hypothetical protein [Acidobacteriota bacterium]
MRFQLYFVFVFSIFALSVCSGSRDSNEASNRGPNVNANPAPSASPSRSGILDADIQTPTPAPTVEAVTLKPLIASFCKARREKDEAALRKLYSAATLRNLMSEARAEGKKSITEYLEIEPVGDRCSVVNERIVGETGEATVITETYPNGVRWTFVKEDGNWKLTDQSSDFERVKKSAS